MGSSKHSVCAKEGPKRGGNRLQPSHLNTRLKVNALNISENRDLGVRFLKVKRSHMLHRRNTVETERYNNNQS